MNEAEQFFISQTMTQVRGMKLPDAVLYLRGLLQTCADENALPEIRRIYVNLSESDRQLELIQTGQLKLPLQNGGQP